MFSRAIPPEVTSIDEGAGWSAQGDELFYELASRLASDAMIVGGLGALRG
jgi:hypothetical protein